MILTIKEKKIKYTALKTKILILTNAADKQYVSLEDFRNEGAEYIEREFASA